MKLGAYTDYDSQRVALAESALFTVWPNLELWHDDLVLVGGLVPRYICGDTSTPRPLPRPVTLDADIGIALGAAAGGMAVVFYRAGLGRGDLPAAQVQAAINLA
jgi:hypothetical protein